MNWLCIIVACGKIVATAIVIGLTICILMIIFKLVTMVFDQMGF